jgi:hypothetical protein
MSAEEKTQNLHAKTTGGYLKTRTLRDAWGEWWAGAGDAERQKILDLPNFDADIFKEITGVETRGLAE